MRRIFRRAKDSFILQTIRDALPGALFAALLVLIYAVVQLNDDRTERREKALVCPSEVDGLVFTHSGFTKLDLARPGAISLNCYYSRRKG